ncbi:MAG: hypothetical protein GY713_01415 [Actinomycetia bacterium]|nr:hypothetical protein [Actinomycetes bacterium]
MPEPCLTAGGLAVANTELMALERPDGRLTAHLIQPLFPAESLGDRVLSSADPDPDHPFLAAVLQFDMDPFLVMIPAPLRAFVRRDMTKLVDRWRQPRRVALDLVANLYREGMDQWVEPALGALNRVERAWQTTVRRRPHDFFIHTTFGEDRTY